MVRPAPRQAIGIGTGLIAFFNGIGFILVTPRVWGYSAVPVLLALLLTCAVGGTGVYEAGRLSRSLFGEPAGTWSHLGGWTLTLVLGLLSLAVGVLLALVLAQPLSGWALEAVSRAQEQALTGDCSAEPSYLASVWLACKVALFTAVVGGGVLGTLVLITFFFPPAGAVTVPLKFLVVAWLLAWNFVDYPLSLRGHGIRARFGWVARHFDAFTAFGIAWAALLILPGMVLLVLPMGVAGATRLVVAADG
jgi:CysZ protein